jgi:hypothetical protein
MPLDDHEQKILAEIERQLSAEDPDLVRKVQNIAKPSQARARLALIGVVVGLAVVIFFFADNTLFALVGFGILVGSATVLVPAVRSLFARDAETKVDDGGDDIGRQNPFRRQ